MKLGLWGSIRNQLKLGTILASGGPTDTTPPTVTIASTESSPSFVNPIPLTFTLSEVSVDFAIGDITVGAGGSIGNFAGAGTSYTADLTITTAGATVTVNIAANAFHDAAGNGNTAATQFSITSGLMLKDEFTTDDNAPLTAPRTCEPGPGTLAITDTNNYLSISSGQLSASNSAASYNGDPSVWSQALTRVAGLGVFGLFSAISARIHAGFDSNQSGDATEIINLYSSANTMGITPGPAALYEWTNPAGDKYLSVIARGTGAFYIANVGGSQTLMWVNDTLTTTPIYANIQSAVNLSTWSCKWLRVAKLGAPWTTDNGIATNAVVSPSVNEVTTSLADSIIEMTWQAVTGQTWNLYVRRTDDTHTWCIRCDQGGGTVKLIEINGSETERASAAQTWTNGTNYRVVVITSGNTINVYVANAQKLTYGSASYNNTATGIKTDRAGTNLITFPRVLSGTALTEFNKVVNP